MRYTGGAVSATAIQLTSGGRLIMSAGANKTLVAGSLSIDSSSKIDLSNNRMIVTAQPVGTWNGSSYTDIAGLLQRGRNAGNWSGSGIVTSQTSATTSNFTSIGVATAQQVKGLSTATATSVWGGRTVTGSNTLVMYTYGGDANLDGKINVDDYGHIDSSIPLGISGWFNGDFNYDGKVNVDDYGIIDFNVGIQGAPFPTELASFSSLAAVPEPAAMATTLLAGAIMILARDRVHPQKRSSKVQLSAP